MLLNASDEVVIKVYANNKFGESYYVFPDGFVSVVPWCLLLSCWAFCTEDLRSRGYKLEGEKTVKRPHNWPLKPAEWKCC